MSADGRPSGVLLGPRWLGFAGAPPCALDPGRIRHSSASDQVRRKCAVEMGNVILHLRRVGKSGVRPIGAGAAPDRSTARWRPQGGGRYRPSARVKAVANAPSWGSRPQRIRSPAGGRARAHGRRVRCVPMGRRPARSARGRPRSRTEHPGDPGKDWDDGGGVSQRDPVAASRVVASHASSKVSPAT